MTASRKPTMNAAVRNLNKANLQVERATRAIEVQLHRDILAIIKLEDQVRQLTLGAEASIQVLNAAHNKNIAPLSDLKARTRRDILRALDEKRNLSRRAPTAQETTASIAFENGYTDGSFLSNKGAAHLSALLAMRAQRTLTHDEIAMIAYLRSF